MRRGAARKANRHNKKNKGWKRTKKEAGARLDALIVAREINNPFTMTELVAAEPKFGKGAEYSGTLEQWGESGELVRVERGRFRRPDNLIVRSQPAQEEDEPEEEEDEMESEEDDGSTNGRDTVATLIDILREAGQSAFTGPEAAEYGVSSEDIAIAVTEGLVRQDGDRYVLAGAEGSGAAGDTSDASDVSEDGGGGAGGTEPTSSEFDMWPRVLGQSVLLAKLLGAPREFTRNEHITPELAAKMGFTNPDSTGNTANMRRSIGQMGVAGHVVFSEREGPHCFSEAVLELAERHTEDEIRARIARPEVRVKVAKDVPEAEGADREAKGEGADNRGDSDGRRALEDWENVDPRLINLAKLFVEVKDGKLEARPIHSTDFNEDDAVDLGFSGGRPELVRVLNGDAARALVVEREVKGGKAVIYHLRQEFLEHFATELTPAEVVDEAASQTEQAASEEASEMGTEPTARPIAEMNEQELEAHAARLEQEAARIASDLEQARARREMLRDAAVETVYAQLLDVAARFSEALAMFAARLTHEQLAAMGLKRIADSSANAQDPSRQS